MCLHTSGMLLLLLPPLPPLPPLQVCLGRGHDFPPLLPAPFTHPAPPRALRYTKARAAQRGTRRPQPTKWEAAAGGPAAALTTAGVASRKRPREALKQSGATSRGTVTSQEQERAKRLAGQQAAASLGGWAAGDIPSIKAPVRRYGSGGSGSSRPASKHVDDFQAMAGRQQAGVGLSGGGGVAANGGLQVRC
jgi:hypothetical protein